MAVTLLVITAISSASLGIVHQLTQTPRDDAALKKQNFAIKAVLGDYDNNPSADAYEIESFDGGDQLTCYPGSKDGELTGVAVKTWTMKGFGGPVRLMAGFDQSGNIIRISVLEQKETPGLGTRMADAEFKDQFNGKNPGANNLSVKKDGGEVDAITAATISSRAFSDAVERAYKSLEKAGKLSHD
ncbi:MAG: RnfABCDGE type electron transport complex subunit G [Bacteroidales bacterium]|nr:RnfABCDGE type electron transport complex subunit G [Bacteroidales bacterium]